MLTQFQDLSLAQSEVIHQAQIPMGIHICMLQIMLQVVSLTRC